MKKFTLYVMAAFYVLAGLNHFLAVDTYESMMPDYLPAHDLLIAMSGLAEVALGLMLFWPKTRAIAAWGIILLLVAILPANVYMYQLRDTRFTQIPAWVLLLRMPLQLLLMGWAYLYTKPFPGSKKFP